MKMTIGLLISAFAFSAFADTTAPAPAPAGPKDVLSCQVAVAGAQPQVSVTMTLQGDVSADFLIVTINDKGQTFRMFTQMAKGEVDAKLSQGGLVLMLLEDTFTQDAGVIRNAGIAVVNLDEQGMFSGLLMAHSNIYPITCKKN